MSKERIKEWYNVHEGKVYVSFSGGKDSTVLLHLVRNLFPNVEAVFLDTGIEYPEVREFIKSIENVTIIKPKIPFTKVIEQYGYPIVSKEVAGKIFQISSTKSDKLRNKRLYGDDKGNGKIPEKWKFLLNAPFKISSQCCDIMKKRPAKKYEKESGNFPFVGTMADDSRLRKMSYLQNGCNSFDSKRPMSTPIAFWTEKDIWDYIKLYNIEYSKIYDMGYDNTGCCFCMFGCHLDVNKRNKFQLMERTHPYLYDYCINKLWIGKCLDFIGVKYTSEDDNLKQQDLFK
jgi:3'-phosphoadenosine 5'-phosphosulfate sulfotransferase (PAPS reductase)/FAD synthetase